jgi:serine/threonine-protein kinase
VSPPQEGPILIDSYAAPSLRTLGGLDLIVRGAEVPLVLHQPKRLGLLIYLASAPAQGYRRRDTLLGLLWPDLDQERARGALRQALYMLRRELGEEVLRGRGEDEVGVDHDRLGFDAVAFERAVVAGDSQGAMELYRGDFLEGFYISGAAAEFDGWVSGERDRLRALAGQAAWAIAESDATSGAVSAAAAIRRAVALAPDDESRLRGAVRLLDRIGDRAGALQLHHEFRDRLAKQYGAQPSTETEALGVVLRSSGAPGTALIAPSLQPEPAGAGTDSAPTAATRSPPATSLRRSITLTLATAAFGIAALGIGVADRRASHAAPLDVDRIVVLPLRIGSDSGLGYLREGMLDLLEARLAGGSGPQLVDPATVISAWRRVGGTPQVDLSRQDALRLARSLGGGRLLLGSVVGGPGSISIQATLYRVADGRAELPVLVSGSRDSLPALVDRFAMALSLRTAGEGEPRLGDLTTGSLAALQAYLGARAAYRAGAYDSAVARFGRALDLDSSFALAGLALALTASQSHLGAATSARDRGLAVARAWQARLPTRDREFLQFVAEPGFGEAALRDRISRWERATALFPDRPDAWYQLGDNLFHWGLQVGIADAEQRAANAFDRAIALDSGFAPAFEHRIWLGAQARDTTVLRQLGPHYVATHPSAERLIPHQWLMAAATGDSATLRQLRSRFAELPTAVLYGISGIAQREFPSLVDAANAITLAERRASTAEEQYFGLMISHDFALNRGQPRQAAAIVERARAVEDPNWTDSEGRILVYDALYQDGDTTAGAAAARQLAQRVSLSLPTEPGARARRYFDLCAAGQWRLSRGDHGYARAAATRLDQTHPPQDQPGDVAEHRVCAAILQLGLALADGGDLAGPADRLDSLLSYSPWVYSLVRQTAIFLLAQSWERRGNAPRALATIRRRELGMWNRLWSTRLREEGRLAVAAGDTTGAIRAYRDYLALRWEPDAALVGEVNRVRGELKRLER